MGESADMVRIGRQLLMRGRGQWRAWLEENHATADEIWLIHYKKHTGKPGLAYEEAVEEALCFGWIDGILKRIDEEKHAIRYSPRRKNSIWSEHNKARVKKLIQEGRMTEVGLGRVREAKENGQWDTAAQREDPQCVPAELKEALAKNQEARDNFEKLAPSRRKQLIWWISSAKRDETRRGRAAKVVQLLVRDKK